MTYVVSDPSLNQLQYTLEVQWTKQSLWSLKPIGCMYDTLTVPKFG